MSFHRVNEPERLHALIDAILLVETDVNLDDLLQTVVNQAVSLTGATYGALGVPAANGEGLEAFVVTGMTDDQRDAIGVIPSGIGLLGETFHHEALRLTELGSHATSVGFPPGHPPMTTFLGVPVHAGDGAVLGSLYLTEKAHGQTFNDADEALVVALGRAAGILIEQARLREQAADATLRAERERFARDLHDTVIQRLFGIGLSLQMILGDGLSDRATTRINEAIDELDATIHEIRTTIFEIDRLDATPATLVERSDSLVREVASRLGVDAALTAPADLASALTASDVRPLLAALRELLSNVVRHSEATHVAVRLDVEGPHVVVTVADNGVGLEGLDGVGRGLRNLRTRARERGGAFELSTTPGGGTTARWSITRGGAR